MKLLLVFILSISFLYSKELKSITLEEAIQIALENNKRNKVSKLALEVANAQYNQALSANYPTINAMLVGIRKDENHIYQQRGNFNLNEEETKDLIQNLTGVRPPVASPLSIPATLNPVSYGRDTVKGSINLE